MTAAQPGRPAAGGVHSLEVRWIFPGPLEAPVAQWFERFPVAVESRVDTYLLTPNLPGVSVKVRGFQALEVKVYGGSPGILDMAGGARGRMESWHKWSFPFRPARQQAGKAGRWRPVRKERRISDLPLIDGGQARCKAELTEIHAGGHAWWTLGFEATGPARLLPGQLRATTALVFAQPLPGGVVPGTDNSASYAEWLHRRPATTRGSRLPAATSEPQSGRATAARTR